MWWANYFISQVFAREDADSIMEGLILYIVLYAGLGVLGFFLHIFGVSKSIEFQLITHECMTWHNAYWIIFIIVTDNLDIYLLIIIMFLH